MEHLIYYIFQSLIIQYRRSRLLPDSESREGTPLATGEQTGLEIRQLLKANSKISFPDLTSTPAGFEQRWEPGSPWQTSRFELHCPSSRPDSVASACRRRGDGTAGYLATAAGMG